MSRAPEWYAKAVRNWKLLLRPISAGAVALGIAGLLFASQDSKSGDSGQAASPEKAAASSPAKSAGPSKPAEYVGSDTCQACHEDIFKGFQRNRHHAVEVGGSRWKGKSCEACHGPGSKHAESADAADIQNPAKMKPADVDRSCLACHQHTTAHSGRVQAGHSRFGVSCVACHAMHKPGSEELTAGKQKVINNLCAQCHVSVMAQFRRPYKHRVPEGAMSCVDCHNPHGSTTPRMTNTVNANEPGCIRCHSEKEGPFAFEHPPVKMEGCRTCHEPHGSANPKMLTRAKEQYLCLECHSNVGQSPTRQIGGVPPAFHDLRLPRFRECSVCHIKVHGSHVDRGFLR